jgi:hypothetical protein
MGSVYVSFQSAPHCVEVVINAKQDNTPVVNRLNVDVGHTVVPADLPLVAAVIDGWITADLAPQQVTQMHYESITCKDIEHANGAQIVYLPTTVQGSVTNQALPNSTAMVASLRTALTGKNYRGRFYFGGMHVNQMVDSVHVSSGVAAGYGAAIADLLTLLDAASYKLVVVSRYLNTARRAVAIATEVITVITNTILDVQRRRSAN